MEKAKLVLRATKETKIIEINDLFDTIDIAKEMVRDAVKNGVENPKVYIYPLWYETPIQMVFDRVAWSIITKKNIAEKVVKAQELTELETQALTKLNNDYNKMGIDNCDFYNCFGKDSKITRGVISSLVRKQVICVSNCPDCFNPLYPSHNFVSTCEKYGIDVSTEARNYCK